MGFTMSTKSVELELFKDDVFLNINLHHEAMSLFWWNCKEQISGRIVNLNQYQIRAQDNQLLQAQHRLL